ncbi:Ankyrin repeat and SAM domain-containing protein 6 [Armadillidium vulgare]|nr:Ankyrin repeat and SAM domain-containing protein 6 [Armadillidium vulgare]
MPFNELVGMEETDILFDIIVEMNKGNLNPFNRFRWGRVDINISDENGNTLLHIASAMGFRNVIEILLRFWPKVEARNSFGCTPIMQASRLGYKDVVEKLIEFDADVTATNCFGLTSFHLAAASGNVELVEYFGILFELKIPRNISENEDIGPLHIASVFGHYKVVESLLVRELDLNRIFSVKGITPLMCAAASGDITSVELFVVKLIRTSILDAMIRNVSYDELLRVVRNGIFGSNRNDGLSALKVASLLNNNNVWKFLNLFYEQLCTEVPLRLGITPLMLASMFNLIDVVDLLLSYDVDVNSVDHVKGWTPFIYSVFYGNSEVALRLYKYGADIHARAFDGVSAFDFLPKLNDDRVVRIFYKESQVGSGKECSKVGDGPEVEYEDDVFQEFGKLHISDMTRSSYPMMSVRRKTPERLKERRGSSAPLIMNTIHGVTPRPHQNYHNGNYFSKETAQDIGTWTGRSNRSSSYSGDKNDERNICCLSPQVHVPRAQIFIHCFYFGNEVPYVGRKDNSEPNITMNNNKRRMSFPVSYDSSRQRYVSPCPPPAGNSFPTTLEDLAKSFRMSKNFTLGKMDLYMSKLGYRRLSQDYLEKIKKADKENEYILIQKT